MTPSSTAVRGLRGGVALRLAGAALGALVLAGIDARRRWSRADDPTGGRPLELPEGSDTTILSHDGARLAVRSMGDPTRPPIVLVHGWTGDRRVWAAVARLLVGQGRHVVVYDQRGHGSSTLGSDGTTLDALAQDLRAVLEGVGARDAVVGGHSMGGMTAQILALDHGDVMADRVAALVLVATASERVVLGPAHLRVGCAILASATTDRLLGSRLLGPIVVRGSVGRRPALVHLDATRTSVLATPPAVRTGFLLAMAGLDLTDRLGALHVPTTVVSGDRDQLTFPSRNRLLAARIPGARLVVVPGAGHQLVFEAPSAVADALGAAADRGGPAPDPPCPGPAARTRT